MPHLTCKDGVRIVGTLERLHGCAGLIDESLTLNPDGTFGFDHDGETKLWWDDQITLHSKRTGQRLFVDEKGETHEERDLILCDDEGRPITHPPAAKATRRKAAPAEAPATLAPASDPASTEPGASHCPYCGGTDLAECEQWSALSAADPGNTASLIEFQCHTCHSRSFWV